MNVSKTINIEAPVSSSIDYAGGTIPFGYLAESGQAVSKTQYARLYEVIGNTYGVHADPTLFYIPDSRGRVNISAENISLLGTKKGTESHVLTESEMPSHTHVQNAHNHQTYNNSASLILTGGSGAFLYGIINSGTTTGTTTATNQNTGGGVAHNNMSPFLVVKKLIKF